MLPAWHGLPGCSGSMAFLCPRLQTNAIALPLIIAFLGHSGLRETLDPSSRWRSVCWEKPTHRSELLSAAQLLPGQAAAPPKPPFSRPPLGSVGRRQWGSLCEGQAQGQASSGCSL